MTKLIEVALPIEAISAASRREKDKKPARSGTSTSGSRQCLARHGGHFSSPALVDDPGDGNRQDNCST